MTRQWIATGMTIVALCGVLSSCSGSDDEPKATPTKASSAAPAATTTAPAPETAVQPTGAGGVTYDIQNWDEYATDPAVLAWKQAFEAVGASINARKVLESMSSGFAKEPLRSYVQSVDQARDGDWHVNAVGQVKIESAQTTATSAMLVTCLWNRSTVLLEKDDTPVGDPAAETLDVWSRQKVEMTQQDGRWVITSADYTKANCAGGAPS